MKLLIVDDEELTRNGLVTSIDWESLGIDEILEADDGVNGLRMAVQKKPDIVLCDVRMPRMNGIEMLEQIELKLPDISAVFMSGYSDKEYLKAAIKLKAVNYIEKPIQTDELMDTMAKAVEQVKNRQYSAQVQSVQSDIFARQLAYSLTVPYHQARDTIVPLVKQSNYEGIISSHKYVTTLIVKTHSNIEDPSVIPGITDKIRSYLKDFKATLIYTEKRVFHTIYHLFSSQKPSEQTLTLISDYVSECFKSLGAYYIAIGNTVDHISDVYNSYSDAVILLESSFFFQEGNTLTFGKYEKCSHAVLSDIENTANAFQDAFQDKNKEAALALLDKLFDYLNHHVGLMQNQVKGIYYPLFATVYRAYGFLKLIPDEKIEVQENLMDIMDSCFSYESMHRTLKRRLEMYYTKSRDSSEENSVILLIRDFIIKNYADPNLSVKSIGEYANLSTSYLCTFFKSETGSTLNQYITEFRIKKAKQLLADPRNKISEIGNQVGYNDGNYFGKSFRKYTGLSPSEYRDQVQNNER